MKKIWTISDKEGMSVQLYRMFTDVDFLRMDGHHQATRMVLDMQAYVPAERKRPNVQLGQLHTELHQRAKGAWLKANSPILQNGTIMDVMNNAEIVPIPVPVNWTPPAPAQQVVDDLFVQPISQPAAEVPSAEAPKPPAQPVLGPELLEMLKKPAVDVEALALNIAALLPQPKPIEVRVDIPIMVPATMDVFEEARKHLSAEQLQFLWTEKIAGAPDPRLAHAKAVRDGVPADVEKKKMIRVTPRRPRGKIIIKALGLDGDQTTTFMKQLASGLKLVEGGVLDFIEVVHGEQQDCEFCVRHYCDNTHPESGRVIHKSDLNNATYKACYGTTSCAREVIQYVQSQFE